MEAYFHSDPRIEEWVDQITEKLFTVCLLTGVDSEVEFQKGSQIVTKLTQLLQGISIFPSEYLEDGLKQLLEQQLPDSRVISNFPTFHATMNKMLHEGMTRAIGPENLNTIDTSNKNNPENSSELVQLKLNHETSVTKASSAIVSSAIVSSGDYRRSRYHQRNTYRRRIGLRQSRPSQEDHIAAKAESTLTDAECGVLLPLIEVGVSRLDEKAKAHCDEITGSPVNALNEEFVTEPAIPALASLTIPSLNLGEAEIENATSLVPSIPTKPYGIIRKTQVPEQADRLKQVLSNIFPNVIVCWNLTLMGQLFLAQVEDILICQDNPDQPCPVKTLNQEGWKVYVCSANDLMFPRRLEREIRHIKRLGKQRIKR